MDISVIEDFKFKWSTFFNWKCYFDCLSVVPLLVLWIVSWHFRSSGHLTGPVAGGPSRGPGLTVLVAHGCGLLSPINNSMILLWDGKVLLLFCVNKSMEKLSQWKILQWQVWLMHLEIYMLVSLLYNEAEPFINQPFKLVMFVHMDWKNRFVHIVLYLLCRMQCCICSLC